MAGIMKGRGNVPELHSGEQHINNIKKTPQEYGTTIQQIVEGDLSAIQEATLSRQSGYEP